ncbi:DUF6629 family protein [Nocardioides sp. Soil796]|uniref:DUF6629 family protein n=1 Tax=Nocardioides sp. Soil796 TaxID=1736412 RepID=UPI00070C33CA|nr:DUF6629 family protein [Nocardioides sp. Soil796]KRF16967.1 hypothetical protein ASH02_02640 [Nocardioides sp. Soil796]
MCFSPEMDVVAGVVVTGIGIDCLRQVTSRRQVALAAVPVVFGVHQLIETLVWWELQGRVGQCTGDVATYSYLVIALLVVPLLIPWAFLRLGVGRSRVADVGFVVAGLTAVAICGNLLGLDAPDRRVDGHQITYFAGEYIPDHVLPVYAVACLGPPLLARARSLQLFGVVNLVVVLGLAALNQGGVISLWCVWAALTSVLVNLHLRRVRSSRDSVDQAGVEVRPGRGARARTP